jgi:hypothetical protein
MAGPQGTGGDGLVCCFATQQGLKQPKRSAGGGSALIICFEPILLKTPPTYKPAANS